MQFVPKFLSGLSEDGVTAVVFASEIPEIASGYAKASSNKYAVDRNVPVFEVRQKAGLVDKLDTLHISNTVDSLIEEKSLPSVLVIYVERLDLLDSHVDILRNLKSRGVSTVVFGAVDIAQQPRRELLDCLNDIRLVNINHNDNSVVV